MKRILPLLIMLAGFLIHRASAQVVDSAFTRYAVKDTQNVNIRLFNHDDLFQISLSFDITKYKRERSDTTYLDAVLTYFTDEGDTINKNIRVKARGKIRRTSAICDFPPLSLNFRMKDTIGGEFIGINKLKIVPYCRIGYEDYVLREYLIYKLYNALTDYSFRVRLLRITFINTARNSKPLNQFGFALEPLKLLEKRTHTSESVSKYVTRKTIKPDIMDRVSIFNYMIGNTDYSVPALHNIAILSKPFSENPELGIAVPFDFDYAGLVNAEYAVPPEILPIENVRERLYMGLCRTDDLYKQALQEFLDKKEEFYRIINDFPYLHPRSKKDMINYLEGFYADFNKRNTIIYKLSADCKDF
jgi:hypothetical protein